MICAICHRAARGFGYSPKLAGKMGPDRHYCSMEHMRMIDKTHDEQAALVAGGNAGGQYLDSIGITDLVTLSVEQYQQYVECVVGGYLDHLQQS